MMTINPHRAGPDAEDALVAALLETYREARRRADRHAPVGARERILAHFERRGERLRGEKLVTAELVQHLIEGTAALPRPRPQQELEIRGEANQHAAGRFRVSNRTAQAATFELIVGDPVEGKRSVTVQFEPQRATLVAGHTRLVRIEVSLMGWDAGEQVTVPVECRWPTGRDRLWVVVGALAHAGFQP